jgi:hypothetical protein
MTTSTRTRQTRRPHIPPVELPVTQNSLDEVVNALVKAWNTQNRDDTAWLFFNTPMPHQRQAVMTNSLYRFHEELDRQFMARQLALLARAILGGTLRWTDS